MKKALQVLSVLLVLCTVVAGVLVFSQAAGTECVLDFDSLPTGTTTKITGLELASASTKTGVVFEIVKDEAGGNYFRWIQGVKDSYIRPEWKASDYADADEDTLTFSIDMCSFVNDVRLKKQEKK